MQNKEKWKNTTVELTSPCGRVTASGKGRRSRRRERGNTRDGECRVSGTESGWSCTELLGFVGTSGNLPVSPSQLAKLVPLQRLDSIPGLEPKHEVRLILFNQPAEDRKNTPKGGLKH